MGCHCGVDVVYVHLKPRWMTGAMCCRQSFAPGDLATTSRSARSLGAVDDSLSGYNAESGETDGLGRQQSGQTDGLEERQTACSTDEEDESTHDDEAALREWRALDDIEGTEEHDAGERIPLQTGVGQTCTGVGRKGGASEGQPQSEPASVESMGKPVSREEATRYRAMPAKCSFLGCDRPDATTP